MTNKSTKKYTYLPYVGGFQVRSNEKQKINPTKYLEIGYQIEK